MSPKPLVLGRYGPSIDAQTEIGRTTEGLTGLTDQATADTGSRGDKQMSVEDEEGVSRSSAMLRSVEEALYLAVAGALALAGLALFVHSIYRFASWPPFAGSSSPAPSPGLPR